VLHNVGVAGECHTELLHSEDLGRWAGMATSARWLGRSVIYFNYDKESTCHILNLRAF
jgi:hypothetical protein